MRLVASEKEIVLVSFQLITPSHVSLLGFSPSAWTDSALVHPCLPRCLTWGISAQISVWQRKASPGGVGVTLEALEAQG